MRLSAIIITFATLATLPPLPFPAPQPKSSQEGFIEVDARSDLAAALAERDRAAEKGDLDRFLSFYAEDFTWKLKDGPTLNRYETEQVLRLSIGSQILEHKQVSTIKGIKFRGREAVLEVEDYSFVKQRLQDASIKETKGTGQKRETWVKTEQGWRLKLIDNANTRETQITVNGQRVDPVKAPNHIVTPAPNTEDQTVLQEGNAIVFVYRLNDGTIVKTPVYCDEVKLAEMTGGSFIKARLTPGKHSCRSEKGSTIDLNIESGKIYFLALRLVAGFPRGRGVLEDDLTGAGAFAYKVPRLLNVRPLGRDNISDVSRVIMEK